MPFYSQDYRYYGMIRENRGSDEDNFDETWADNR